MTTPAENYTTSAARVGHYRELALPSGTVLANFDYVTPYVHQTKVRPASVNNPRRADGTRPPSVWVSRGGTIRGATGYVHTREAYRDRTWSGMIVPPFNAEAGNIAAPMSFSDGNALALRDALGHFGEAHAQLGVALKETRETAGLLRSYYQAASRGATELYRDLGRSLQRDGNIKKGAAGNVARQWQRFLNQGGWKQAPSRYLEYLYGLRPLADDINNALDVLTEVKQQGHGFKMTLRGTFKLQTVANITANSNVYKTVAKFSGPLYQTHRASLVFNLPSWYWDRLPPVTAFTELWDTTRLSFVLDWVVPVRDWIRGFEGFQLRPFFQEGSVSGFLLRTINSVELDKGSQNFLLVQDLAQGTSREYYFSRQALSQFPAETLLRPPRFVDTLGIRKLNQAAALAGQRLAALSNRVDHVRRLPLPRH